MSRSPVPAQFVRSLATLAILLAGSSRAAAQESDAPAPLDVPCAVKLPSGPGDSFYVALAPNAGAPLAVIVTRAPDHEIDPVAPNAFTPTEMASAIVVPWAADAAGNLVLSGVVPDNVSAEALVFSDIRVRLVTIDDAGMPYLSDPIEISSPVPTASSDASAEAIPSGSELAPDLVASNTSSMPGPGPGGSNAGTMAGAVGPGGDAGEEDDGLYGFSTVPILPPGNSGPSASKAAGNTHPGSTTVERIVLRPNPSRYVLTHDQPVPISGSGH